MTVALVQARMGSMRLPGKVLADVSGRPMLWHVVNRLRSASRIDVIAVVTSDVKADDAIEAFCTTAGVPCYRGSEHDVLDRYYQAGRWLGAKAVVRITGDCPLVDPCIVDRVIASFEAEACDYASNIERYTYPDGLDVEVFSMTALERAWREATASADREHVTPYLRSTGRFRTTSVEYSVNLGHQGHRWTVDEHRDLEFVRAVYAELGDGAHPFGMSEVVELLKRRPEISAINQGLVRNEGYFMSIAREVTGPTPAARSLERTSALLERARAVIPSRSQTFSKGPTQFVQGVSPAFLVRGKGSRVWDVDGNEYIDYVSGLGPVILGYDHPAVTEAAVEQVRKGVSFSLPHPLEVQLAELLVELIPCAEMVRFGKNGSDATAGAVRAARGFTGRDTVACCGYHGWQDWFIGTTTRHLGVPSATRELTRTFEYNDLSSLERVFEERPEDVAAVIMEPVGLVEPEAGFLEGVRELARRHGALLIFDEVVTGFRIHMGGAQAHYGVTPDLACFGKAMANGFPLSAVVGRRDVMEIFDRIFFSFTFGGEAVSLAAALATLKELEDRRVIPFLWDQGEKLRDGYNIIAREAGLASNTACIGLAPHTVMTFSGDGADGLILRSLLQQELVKRGVLFLVGHNVTFSHSDDDVEITLRAYRDALGVLAAALRSGDPRSRLEGAPVEPVFRQA